MYLSYLYGHTYVVLNYVFPIVDLFIIFIYGSMNVVE
jgi:hypothetical protein